MDSLIVPRCFYITIICLLFSVQCESFCYDFNSKTKAENHDYFLLTTKTPYLTAREHIRNKFPSKWPSEINQCSPVYFYLLKRHSIRYPKDKEIVILDEFLADIRQKILSAGLMKQNVYNGLKDWIFRMTEEDGYHVTLSGIWQTAKTAKIFNNYYPELLNISNVNFDVGYSKKVRTRETADSFVDSLIFEQYNNISSLRDLDEIKDRKFNFTELPLMLTHKTCKQLLDSPPDISKDYTRLIESDSMKYLLMSFSDRIGIQYTLSLDSVINIYKICQYEIALFKYSPWCPLFNEPELKLLEYMYDIELYHESYEVEPYPKIGCAVIGDMYRKMQSIIETRSFVRNSTLYFSHEHLLSRIFSYLGLFKYFPVFKEENGKICLPDNREWLSSLILPFGTNFASILYKCDAGSQKETYKIFNLINEIPVTIRGCKSAFCDINDFYREYGPSFDTCDLQKICQKKR